MNGWRQAQKRGESEDEFLRKANYAGRDNARTPVQWSAGQGAGFSSASPWMPINPNYSAINVSDQEKDSNSILNYFRRMVKVKKSYSALVEGDYKPLDSQSKEIFLFFREKPGEKLLVALNFSTIAVNFPLPIGGLKKVIGNYDEGEFENRLRPWEAIVFECRE